MLVKQGALLFTVNNPAKIKAVLPQAKHIRHMGKELIAVKHTLDTARVLNNLGLKAPSPILTQYDFPGMYTPMEKQLKTADFLTLNPRAYVFNEMRTGKTASALWAAEYLLRIGAVRRVLVVCPLSVMDVWSNEAFRTVTHLPVAQLVGNVARKLDIASGPEPINIINFDGLRTLYHEERDKRGRIKRREHKLKGKYDLIIVDEADAYHNAQNVRHKALEYLIEPDTWLWEMTGTPINKAPTDAYGMIKLSQPHKLPASFTLFEEYLMRKVGPFKKVPREGALDYVFSLMQPAIRFTRDKDGTLPTTTQDIKVEMSKTQHKAFEDMKQAMYYEDQGIEVTAVNAAVKLIKLQQIMCGAVKDDTGVPTLLDPKPRLEQTLKLIRGASKKTVVFVPFIASMELVKSYLEKHGLGVELVNGDTSKGQRERAFTRFKTDASCQVLVAHPKVTSHGLDLTCADTFIWYAPTFSSLTYEQANARGEGPNKDCAVGIYHIGCHPVEWAIYEAVAKKLDMGSQLLSMYELALS